MNAAPPQLVVPSPVTKFSLVGQPGTVVFVVEVLVEVLVDVLVLVVPHWLKSSVHWAVQRTKPPPAEPPGHVASPRSSQSHASPGSRCPLGHSGEVVLVLDELLEEDELKVLEDVEEELDVDVLVELEDDEVVDELELVEVDEDVVVEEDDVLLVELVVEVLLVDELVLELVDVEVEDVVDEEVEVLVEVVVGGNGGGQWQSL